MMYQIIRYFLFIDELDKNCIKGYISVGNCYFWKSGCLGHWAILKIRYCIHSFYYLHSPNYTFIVELLTLKFSHHTKIFS